MDLAISVPADTAVPTGVKAMAESVLTTFLNMLLFSTFFDGYSLWFTESMSLLIAHNIPLDDVVQCAPGISRSVFSE